MFPTSLLPPPFAIFEKMKFWVLGISLAFYVITFYVPNFPLTEEIMLQIVIGVLALFGVHLEVKARVMARFMQGKGILPLS
jgi:hypothetical protein